MQTGLITAILPAGAAAIEAAAARLSEGGLVAFPTETVYGLGADATNADTIARLYQAKGRPSFNPLISHVNGQEAAQAIGRFDANALLLANAFWPGPLTLVLPRAAPCAVAELATAGLDTIAIRVPAHPVARAILRAFGKPVVAPSANLSGHVSATTAAHVQSDLGGRVDLIVDGAESRSASNKGRRRPRGYSSSIQRTGPTRSKIMLISTATSAVTTTMAAAAAVPSPRNHSSIFQALESLSAGGRCRFRFHCSAVDPPTAAAKYRRWSVQSR